MDKRPLKVFLCHARADRDAVRALYTRLPNGLSRGLADKSGLIRLSMYNFHTIAQIRFYP